MLGVRVATRGCPFHRDKVPWADGRYQCTQLAPMADSIMVTPIARYAVAFAPLQARSATPAYTPQTVPGGPAVPEDSVNISAAGRQQARDAAGDQTAAQGEADGGGTGLPTPGTSQELDATAQRVLQSLRQRDQEVRLHEQAHLLAAGPHATGGPSYTYQTGPDGQRYAVGGEVPIDLSAVPGDPQATLQKALTIRRAALAPTHPSSADQAVAAKATSLAAQAQQELLQSQSAGRLTTQRAAAAQAETGPATAESGTTSETSATRHVCGPNCQNHGAGPAPGANIPLPANPLTIVTTALQSYQVAANIVPA